jgi:anti-sigma factor RsiW
MPMNGNRIALAQQILVALVDQELPAAQGTAVEATLTHNSAPLETVRRPRAMSGHPET